MDRSDQLHTENSVKVTYVAVVLDGITHLDQLERIRAEADGRFVSLTAGFIAAVQIACARRYIPPGMQNPFGFEVARVFPECGNCVVIHFEPLPFAVYVPMAVSPLDIRPHRCRRQIPRARLAGKKVWEFAIKVGPAVGGYSDV